MLADGYHDVAPGKLAMVVTYLEMTAPHLRDVPCPDGLTFAELPRDLETYRDVIRRVGQDWLWGSRLMLSDDELSEILANPAIHPYTLEKAGRPEAILELDFRVPGECELAFYGLTPELIGTGAGAYLMDRGVERAFGANINRFHLHTCTLDSPQALGFYIRSGFSPYARKVEIMEDPRVTGLLPRSVAPQVPIL